MGQLWHRKAQRLTSKDSQRILSSKRNLSQGQLSGSHHLGFCYQHAPEGGEQKLSQDVFHFICKSTEAQELLLPQFTDQGYPLAVLGSHALMLALFWRLLYLLTLSHHLPTYFIGNKCLTKHNNLKFPSHLPISPQWCFTLACSPLSVKMGHLFLLDNAYATLMHALEVSRFFTAANMPHWIFSCLSFCALELLPLLTSWVYLIFPQHPTPNTPHKHTHYGQTLKKSHSHTV